jgi:myo-inositol-1(or 4)-monophosphatase
LASEQALGAGELLLERYRAGIAHGVHSKSTPTDLVSDADLEAERYIRDGIARERPGDGMVGEEGDDRPGESGLRWVVDPLDGTVNYLFGIPHWCVSVAVQDGEGTLAGAVCDPLRGELFTAVRGGNAELMSTGETRSSDRIGLRSPCSAASSPGDLNMASRDRGGHETQQLTGSTRAELASTMVATGFAYDAGLRAAQAKVLERLLPRVRDIRRAGAAALDLAWTAAGRYDAYYERGVQVWDVAAGVLMCERAGLQIRELPEAKGLPWGVLVAAPEIVEELLGLVSGAPSTGPRE